MADKNDYSALRLLKENITVFQDMKLAYESRHFCRLSNDEFFRFLTGTALSSLEELSADYERVVGAKAKVAALAETE